MGTWYKMVNDTREKFTKNLIISLDGYDMENTTYIFICSGTNEINNVIKEKEVKFSIKILKDPPTTTKEPLTDGPIVKPTNKPVINGGMSTGEKAGIAIGICLII